MRTFGIALLHLLTWSLCFSPLLFATDSVQKLEVVRGSGCYRFGDDETPAKAKRAAMALAQEEAVRRHRVFVEASTRVKNFQLDEDVVRTASAAFLQDVVIEKEERQNQEICVTLTAKLSPISAEEMLRQKIAAKEISQKVETALIPSKQAFGLKIWTNKKENTFIEDDRLIIYVKSDRDAYLRLDYFQADGKVVHLVPNIYRGQEKIIGGETYTFGDEYSPDQFIVKEPYGDEIIKAVVSSKPFDIPNAAEAVGESRTYLQEGLRGIKLVAAEASLPLKTMSKNVDEYNKFWTQREEKTGQANRVTMPQSK
ncbi:MAG TPA: DUF4384 domain-containing protein [Anaerolineales bacterium]|nr:DUF4384 domain-containing protein [Anaerolineales bacterium]